MAGLQGGGGGPQGAQPLHHLVQFLLPLGAEGGPVEGVLEPLHPPLVAVVGAGDAGDGELQCHCQAGAPFALGGLVVADALQERGLVGPVHPLPVDLGAQHRADAGHVVGGEQVHQAVIHGFGVVALLGAEEVPQFQRGGLFQQVVDDRPPEGVVHHAVEPPAQGVLALVAVALLDGGVLPDLAQQQVVLAAGLDLFAHQGDDLVGQLVCHIQPEAGGPQPQPAVKDAALAGDHVLLPAGFALVDLGQGVKPPPAAVVFPVAEEVEPPVVGGLLPLVGAQVVVVLQFVEVDAVAAGVGEHPVTEDADAALLGLEAEAGKGGVAPQQGVHLLVVAGVVAMVGVGLHNGV